MNARREVLRLALGLGTALLGGCAGGVTEKRTDVIRLWVAPNEAEEGFWKIAVARWNESGRGLPVNFTTIPTAGNSEDTVLSALVAGTEPDLCTNIFSGFAIQLAALGQAENLAEMPGYAELVARRDMGAIMPGWTQNGQVSAMPIYSSPTLLWWRADLLEKHGLSAPPRTYDEVYAFCDRYGIARSRYGMQVVAGRSWQDRWFDFISFYYAASGGQPYLTGTQALYDNAAGLEAATFMDHVPHRLDRAGLRRRGAARHRARRGRGARVVGRRTLREGLSGDAGAHRGGTDRRPRGGGGARLHLLR